MLHSELVTSIHEEIKINIVLFVDNSGFRKHQQQNKWIMELKASAQNSAFVIHETKLKPGGDIMRINFAQSGEAL